MNAAARIEGWCPGALRPMESGDGLIVRLRLSCGQLTPLLAGEIADWGEVYGNGQIDLTARANLQLRGVSRATLSPLLEAMKSRGLLDANAEAEAVRNVLVSPFAGPDFRRAAKALEAELSANPSLWRLPGKFGFSLDAGPYPMGDTLADVAFEAMDSGSFRVRLAGAEATLGPVAIETVVAVAVRIAEAFLASEPKLRRMREAVAHFGTEALAAVAGLRLLDRSAPPGARPLAAVLGLQEGFVGAALPFGRIRAAELRAFAGAAAASGCALQLTPWRMILALGAAARTPSWPSLSRPSTSSNGLALSETGAKPSRGNGRTNPAMTERATLDPTTPGIPH